MTSENKTPSAGTASELATVTVSSRIPEFWCDQARLWFVQCEAILTPQKLSDEAKFNLVVTKLGKDVIQQVQVSLTTGKFLKNTSPKPTTYRRVNVDRNDYDFYNYNILVELDVSLTTSKLPKSTSPKPTTLHKRINVGKNYYESANSSGLEELLQYAEAKSKRNSETYSIVDWDYWCRLQVRKGNCQKALDRFYYDIQTDECKPFVYTGCGGNKNNFYTSDFCERNCKGALDTNIKDIERPEFCSLQAQTGFCLALISQFYYDINEETCLKFNYGGCGGNQNRFSSMSACMKTCSDKEEEFE